VLKLKNLIFTSLLILATANCFGETLIDLNKKHFEIIRGSEQSFDYDLKASNFLVFDVNLASNCAPNGFSDVSDMYYEISAEGKVSNIWFFPEITESKCITNRMKSVIFPKPPKTHIGLENIQNGD